MTLVVGDLTRVRCLLCGADHDQPGFLVEDGQHVEMAVCSYHLLLWLGATLKPVLAAALDA